MPSPPFSSEPLLSEPATPSSSKPPSTAPQDLEPQSQVHEETLARLGIKVIDFAYESKLPPLRSWHKRQFQPDPLSLKRPNLDQDENAPSITPGDPQSAGGSGSKKVKLRRKSTEPNLQTAIRPLPARDRVFVNILEYEAEPISQSSGNWSQPSETLSSQPPPLDYFDSENSQPYIDTPLVSPSGVQNWKATHGDIPISTLQLNMSPAQPLLNHSPKFTFCLKKDRTGLLGDVSPLSSLSSIISDASPSSLPTVKDRGHATVSENSRLKGPLGSSSLKRIPETRSPPHTYWLRQRPAAKAALQTATITPRSKRRTKRPSSRDVACPTSLSRTKSKPNATSSRRRKPN